MNKFAYIGIGFSAGAGCGALAGYSLTKKKMDEKKKEEIESIKETYRMNQEVRIPEQPKQNDQQKEAAEMAKAAREKSDILQVLAMQYQEPGKEPEVVVHQEDDEDLEEGIRIITAAEYASEDYEEYRKIALKYYPNNYLLDNNNEIISDISGTVGSISVNDFDSDDILYVRNNRLHIDFDIQKVDEPFNMV